MYKKLSREDKRMFNKVLLSFGYKVDTALGMVIPTNQFATRDWADGLQPHTNAGKKIRRIESNNNN